MKSTIIIRKNKPTVIVDKLLSIFGGDIDGVNIHGSEDVARTIITRRRTGDSPVETLSITNSTRHKLIHSSVTRTNGKINYICIDERGNGDKYVFRHIASNIFEYVDSKGDVFKCIFHDDHGKIIEISCDAYIKQFKWRFDEYGNVINKTTTLIPTDGRLSRIISDIYYTYTDVQSVYKPVEIYDRVINSKITYKYDSYGDCIEKIHNGVRRVYSYDIKHRCIYEYNEKTKVEKYHIYQ